MARSVEIRLLLELKDIVFSNSLLFGDPVLK